MRRLTKTMPTTLTASGGDESQRPYLRLRSSRAGNTVRKAGVGAAVGALVLLGVMIARWIPSFGIGEGAGDGAGATSLPSDSVATIAPTPGAPLGTPPPAVQPLPTVQTGVVDVIIDGREYQIRQSDESLQAATTADIIAQALAAPAGTSGPRLRVFRRENAMASAEEELAAALRGSTLKSVDILWVKSLIP